MKAPLETQRLVQERAGNDPARADAEAEQGREQSAPAEALAEGGRGVGFGFGAFRGDVAAVEVGHGDTATVSTAAAARARFLRSASRIRSANPTAPPVSLTICCMCLAENEALPLKKRDSEDGLISVPAKIWARFLRFSFIHLDSVTPRSVLRIRNQRKEIAHPQGD